MRLVVQRVRRASVDADGAVIGEIGPGAVVLAGVGESDTPEIIDAMAEKLVGLRYFEDGAGRTNRDLREGHGALLVVSQFTLYADLRRGRRPGFSHAADPALAEPLIERFVDRLRDLGAQVETGRFRAQMGVALVNDGPFTLVLDSATDLAAGS
jgi:D-tyrosyl-tRNA(Tyr) deacylase